MGPIAAYAILVLNLSVLVASQRCDFTPNVTGIQEFPEGVSEQPCDPIFVNSLTGSKLMIFRNAPPKADFLEEPARLAGLTGIQERFR
jgi:hypothetical protein